MCRLHIERYKLCMIRIGRLHIERCKLCMIRIGKLDNFEVVSCCHFYLDKNEPQTSLLKQPANQD